MTPPEPGRSLGPEHLPPTGTGEPVLPPELNPRGRGTRSRPARPEARGGSRQVLPATGGHVSAGRVGRAVSVVAATVSVAILATSGVGYALYAKYDGQINRIGPLRPSGTAAPPASPGGARNVLLIGSDTRATTGKQFQGKGKDFTAGQRADTIILAHIYGNDQAAQLVSFPRDSYVQIPAHTDPKTGVRTPDHMDKINSALSEGGVPLLVATLEQLTRVRIDNQVTIDFAGFQSMVDAVGGVEVCLKAAAKEPFSGIDLPAGRQTVRGAQALAFVRQRHQLPRGDLDRIGRQQAFIGSLVRKVLSAGTLTNPGRLNDFLNQATANVSVDDGFSGNELLDLARQLKNVGSGGVAFTTIPITDLGASRPTSAGNSDVVLIDKPKADVLFTQLRTDTAPAQLTAPAPAPTTPAAEALIVKPASIKVDVLNGAGTRGLGSRVAGDLVKRGFSVPSAAGNRGSGATGTVVRYGPDKADSARTVAAAVPGATLELDPTLGSTLELVVGSDYTGAVAVSVTAPSAAPTPAPGGPAPLTTAADAGCVN